MADAAVDGERPPQPPAEDAEHADDVPGAEAPFDFAAMRPAGALAKVARHEMFAQPPNKCQLGCCKLNSDFSENNAKWTGKEELGENRRERTGLELEQVQLTEQRLFYRRILIHNAASRCVARACTVVGTAVPTGPDQHTGVH